MVFIYKLLDKRQLEKVAEVEVDVEEFLKNPIEHYEEWDSKLHKLSTTNYIEPIWDSENSVVRLRTREETIIEDNRLDLLEPGEVFENGVIKTIPRPQGFRIEWEYPNWVEKATKNEQLEYLKQEILRNTRELMVYKESGFSNDELQNKINNLVEKHKVISEELATSIEYYIKK